MGLELYTLDLSPFAQMVEIQLALKGIEYTRTVPSREFAREGGFEKITPLRKIPTLLVDGTVVPETQVIFELIEELYPNPALLPADPIARAHVRLLARIGDIYFSTPLVHLLNNKFEGESKDISAYGIGTIERGMKALEHWISPGPYAAGDVRSLADCVIPPALFSLKETMAALDIGGLPAMGPKTTAYYDAIQRDEHVGFSLGKMAAALQQRFGKAA